ncbi:TlpA disulfide reductase family protein [Alicyclobacillus sp.]|uniref:TlpA family protein disulfide reductase n=1 Tax=Alicyclobacillus sp. TaxID=61169 RepID=UPI0025BB00E5|nr:TlpA disulfide reductase family protein [Alicyclobacillus sp.]MCL6517598.1 TlpA family protein disulfide reductase [Alicyclobacillus sp.]
MKRIWGLAAVTLAVVGCGTPASAGGETGAANSAAVSQGGANAATPAMPLVGHPAPDFALPKLTDGGVVRLSDLRKQGQVLVLNTWASWCGPCIDEMPVLVDASRRYQGKVQFVGINMTVEDSAADAKRFVETHHIPYLTLLDPQGAFLEGYHIVGTPTTFIVRPDGVISNSILGPVTKASLDAAIQRAMTKA